MLVSQFVRSDFGKCIINLRLNLFDFLLRLFEEWVCLCTGKRVFNLLLLDASEKMHLLTGGFRMVNSASLRKVALGFESLINGNGLSLDDATFEIFGLCESVSAW